MPESASDVTSQNLSIDRIYEALQRLTGTDPRTDRGFYLGDPQKELWVSWDGLQAHLNQLQEITAFTGNHITQVDYFEHVVDDARQIPQRFRNDVEIKDDGELGETYRIGHASPIFLLCAIHELSENEIDEAASTISRRLMYLERRLRLEGASSLLWSEVVKSVLGSPVTVSVKTEKKSSAEKLSRLFESFIFHVSYNTGRPLLPRSSTPANSEVRRRTNRSQARIDGIDIPRRAYVAELVYHYQLGLSAESPVLAFLSYYHVLEYWYENVFMEELTSELSDVMTQPNFSFRRNSDLKKLVKQITKSAESKGEDMYFSEEKALGLTLRKYIKSSALKDSLEDLSPGITSHYANHSIAFSGGPNIEWSADDKRFYGPLAKRIYYTRNSLVHSKDSDKKRFKPFKDDGELSHEVSLLRCVSELVIIGSASKR